MFRALLTPRWALALVLALLFAVACIYLGRWQWGKYEVKVLRAKALSSNYSAAPVPLGLVLTSTEAPLSEAQEWTRVTTSGRYAGQHQLLVRNRPLQSTPGFEVLVPLDLGGRYLLVDRGWVPSGSSAAVLPDVPAAPQGAVTVTGWLRRGEEDLGRALPVGQLASIDIRRAEEQIGVATYDAYLVLESEALPSSVVPPRPPPLERPSTDLGPNQAYAIQWWLFSVAGVGLVGQRMWVHVHQRGGAPTSPSAARMAMARRTRIWDEEDY